MMWIRRTIGKPHSRRTEPEQQIWHRIAESFEGDDEGAFLNLHSADKDCLEWLAHVLRIRGYGKTYGRAFRKLATEILEFLNAHAVDRLAAVVDPPKPKEVKITGKTARDRAAEKIKRKYL